MRKPRPTILPATSLVLPLLAALALSSWLAAEDATEDPATAQPRKTDLRREGTHLADEPGRFIAAANRLTFVSSSGANYIGLENLNLERVGKVVATSSDMVDWFITGAVTEYQGANYVLIARARRKAATPRLQRRF